MQDHPAATPPDDPSEEGSELVATTSHDFVLPRSFPHQAIPIGPYQGRDLIGGYEEAVDVTPNLVASPPGGYRPEMVCDAAAVGELWIAAASIRGLRHQERATVRQDATALGVTADQRFFIGVISDGVSEGKLSHLVADVAAQAALRETTAALGEGPRAVDWNLLSQRVREAVRQRALAMLIRSNEAGEQSEDPSDRQLARRMSTTVSVLVAASQREDNKHTVTFATLAGDASAYLLHPDYGWRTVSAGKHQSELETNSVVALPMDPGPPRVSHFEVEAGEAVAAVTDGFGDAIRDGDTSAGSYLLHAWAKPLSVTEFLRTASFVSLAADDDRTAVVVWPR